MFDLSLMHFFKILKVPIKFVLKTLSGLLSEASIAGSAQQSITKLNLEVI